MYTYKRAFVLKEKTLLNHCFSLLSQIFINVFWNILGTGTDAQKVNLLMILPCAWRIPCFAILNDISCHTFQPVRSAALIHLYIFMYISMQIITFRFFEGLQFPPFFSPFFFIWKKWFYFHNIDVYNFMASINLVLLYKIVLSLICFLPIKNLEK